LGVKVKFWHLWRGDLLSRRIWSTDKSVLAWLRAFVAAVTVTIGPITLSVPSAAAQDFSKLPEAPRVTTVDEVGVDLRSGQYQARGAHWGIGPKDAPVLSITVGAINRWSSSGTPLYSKVERGCDQRYDPVGGETKCRGGLVDIYTLGHETFVYMPDPHNPFAPRVLTDGSLVSEDDIYIDVRRSDGAFWRFLKVTGLPPGWSDSAPGEYAFLKTITWPDGSALDYDARGVTSTMGYRMEFEPANGSSFLNLSEHYCSAGLVACSGLNFGARSNAVVETAVAYGNSAIVEKEDIHITSVEGVRIDLRRELIGATSPSHTGSDQSSYCGGMFALRTKSISNQIGVWNYEYTFEWDGGSFPWGYPQCRITESISTGPEGGVFKVKGQPGSLEVTDALGRVTKYQVRVWPGTSYENYADKETGEILSAIYPEGNRSDYEYVRNNLSKVTETPKPGGGAARVTFQAAYPADCSEVTIKVCNKPIYTIDARGARTDYTYHGPSGMVETVTGPAGSDGVRPQTRYGYQQLEARILNASGQLVPTGRPIWKLTSVSQCRTQPSCAGSADETIKSYTYNNNLLPITETTTVGDNSIGPVTTGTTYDAVGNVVAADGPLPGAADTTYFVYNAYRELVATISPDPDGAGPLPRMVERNVYNLDGKPIRVEIGTAQTTDASDFVLDRYKRLTYDSLTGRLMKVEEVQP